MRPLLLPIYIIGCAHLVVVSFAFFFWGVHGNPQFSFASFDTNQPLLRFSENSNVDSQALQVTRNSGTDYASMANTSGQITYADSLRLSDDDYAFAASFNTSFVLNMGPINLTGSTDSTGGGMAFMLTSETAMSYFPDSFGMFLGLFNGSSSQQQPQLVAIEFDTFKDSFDPDANHVGIDFDGSVVSHLNESLSPHNVALTTSESGDGVYTGVWIDYDGISFTLDVYIANQANCDLSSKPADPIISGYYIDLRNYLPQTVYVGFSASLGTKLETHCVCRWSFTSNNFPQNRHVYTLYIVIGTILFIALVASMAVFLFWRRRRSREIMIPMEALSGLGYGPQKFTYKQIKRATKGFSKECRLAQGGFGEVYKGELRSSDGETKEVAVKLQSQKSKQGPMQFKAEIMSMGKMSHKNLVKLLGWSHKSGKLALVYEYMCNGSLDMWISGSTDESEGREVMGWQKRFHVMKGIAAGLLYLHEEWETVVIHRDLKPSNVMLDAEFNAKIGDFGLAKLMDMELLKQRGNHITAHVAGTFGYMAPEHLAEGVVSKETDIYSLGAIAIELATGQRNISMGYIHQLQQSLLETKGYEKYSDPLLEEFDPSQLQLLLTLGLACCHPHPPARPSIREVVHSLQLPAAAPMPIPAWSSFEPSYAISISRALDSQLFTTISNVELSRNW